MRIQLDNHLYLEEAQGVWYLTSTEPYKVAWKTDIPQLVTAWRDYSACGWKKIEAELKAAQEKTAELEQEVRSWKTGQRCATQHIMKECYESRLNDIADLRKRCDELEARNAELQKERDETANHLHAGRERLEKIAMQAAQLTGCRKAIKELEDKVAAYEEHVVIGLGQKVLLKHNMAVSLSEALEERRELKVRVFHLEKELKNQKPGPPNVSWVVHGNELQLFHQGVLCCSVDSEGLVRVTGKTLWRSTHVKHYNDVETLYTQAGKLDELAQENKKLAANVSDYEELLEGIEIKRGETVTITFRDKHVSWWADGTFNVLDAAARRHVIQWCPNNTVNVWTHDTTWHDAAGTPNQVASLVADVETLKRELALARPTFEEWVERIKKAEIYAVELAKGKHCSVWACLGVEEYLPTYDAKMLLGLPDVYGLTNRWGVYKRDDVGSGYMVRTREWAKRQKVQE